MHSTKPWTNKLSETQTSFLSEKKSPNTMAPTRFLKIFSISTEPKELSTRQSPKQVLPALLLAPHWWDWCRLSNTWLGTSLFKPLITLWTVVPKPDTWLPMNSEAESFSEDSMDLLPRLLPNIHSVSPVTTQASRVLSQSAPTMPKTAKVC